MVGLLPDHVSYYPHMLAPGQKTASGPCPSTHFTTQSHYRRRSPGLSGHVDAFAAHQSDAGITGKTRISYIYVTQHIGMMKHISDQVLVMHQGEVVERGVQRMFWPRRCMS